MFNSDPYAFLKTVIAKEEAEAHTRTVSQPRTPLIVTLSRDYAAQGESIAQELGKCLGIPVYDRDILERVASKAKLDTFKLESLDESVPGAVSTLVYSLMTTAGGELYTYRRALYDVVLELAKQDCLLVGRGAHLILANKKVFRIRIVGSKIVCAKRLAEESGLSLPEAERKVYEINSKRHKSIHHLFGDSFEHGSLEYAANFDVVINTDRIAAEDTAPILLLAMKQAGFALHGTASR